MNTYDEVGNRVPFEPDRVAREVGGCRICGREVAMVVVFVPESSEMIGAVLRLRTHAVPARRTPAVAYGLCGEHAADKDAAIEHVEADIVAAADRMVVQ